ncbi:SCO7613 C-terminal domain-containing membrane protein, partial [Streptomyces sp. NPDC055060]
PPASPPGDGRGAAPGGRSVRPPVAATRAGALAVAWAALLVLPSALPLPYATGISAYVALTAALLAVASRAASTAVARTSLGLAVASSVSVALLALATTGATLGTLGALTALFLGAAVLAARREGSAAGVADTAVCAGVAYATALLCAAGAARDLPLEHVGLLVLAVPALGALVAARLGRHPLTLRVEIAGAVAGGLALALTAGHAATLALALGLGGVIAAGTALRADRRRVGYAAGALFLLATWVRLAAWDVVTPEAYTVPVTVPALVIGVLRRRAPETSSWAAYGPGLAATLLPSLVAAWSDAHWQRPLLLGGAALLITLMGARQRLQAPLVLGGTVLALDALHELAPYIVQVVDSLPRWLPMALAGLLLLAIGATYEHRLRDARRVRDVLGRMH